MSATQGRKNFYSMLKEIQAPGVSVIILHEGQPKGVFMSFEEFEGWQETMEIMGDPVLSRGLAEDIKRAKQGKLDTMDYDTFRKRLKL